MASPSRGDGSLGIAYDSMQGLGSAKRARRQATHSEEEETPYSILSMQTEWVGDQRPTKDEWI